MRTAVLTLALAALAVAAPARAQYAPPGMTFGPTGAAPEPAGASTTASRSAGWEWSAGVVAGRRTGWWSPASPVAPGFAAVPELSLLGHLGAHAVAGAKLTAGLAVEAVGGARWPLTRLLRLDLLADAGLTRQELSASETYWAPTVGARGGVTLARPGGGAFLTIGLAMVRRIPDRTVSMVCIDGSTCGTIALGGGTLVGAFVTAGSAHPRDGGTGP